MQSDHEKTQERDKRRRDFEEKVKKDEEWKERQKWEKQRRQEEWDRYKNQTRQGKLNARSVSENANLPIRAPYATETNWVKLSFNFNLETANFIPLGRGLFSPQIANPGQQQETDQTLSRTNRQNTTPKIVVTCLVTKKKYWILNKIILFLRMKHIRYRHTQGECL